MTAKELLNPRFEVIADYPSSLYGAGDLVEEHEPDKFHYQNCGDYQYASAQTLRKYPHLFFIQGTELVGTSKEGRYAKETNLQGHSG